MVIANPFRARLQTPDYSDTLIVKLESKPNAVKAVENLRAFGVPLRGLKQHLDGRQLEVLQESKLRSLLSGNALRSITPLFNEPRQRVVNLLDEIEGVAKSEDVQRKGRLVLRFNTPQGAKSALKPLLADALVKYAHFPGIRSEAQARVDPKRNFQWGLPAIDFFNARRPSAVSAKGRIAMIDTGVDTQHPEFDEDLLATRNFSQAAPGDTRGHGTHIAGIIAADAMNEIGIHGICHLRTSASLVSYKALGPFSAEGYYRALGELTREAPMVRVLNLSLSGTDFDQTEEDLIRHAIETEGIAVVAAMGNNGSSVTEYPAGIEGVIAVGALRVDCNDRLTESNTGPHLLLLAPGESILSTVPVAGSDFAGDAEHMAMLSGTSMATAFVTAAIALMRTKNPDLTPDDIRDVLIEILRPRGRPGSWRSHRRVRLWPVEPQDSAGIVLGNGQVAEFDLLAS